MSVAVGASLTGVTVMEAVAVLTLNAVVPPLILVSAVPPTVPVDLSQARKLRALVIVPL